MRFKKLIPKENWPVEKTHERIEAVKLDIAAFNKAMNRIDGKINALVDDKKTIARKVAYKWKYLRQLELQLLSEQ